MIDKPTANKVLGILRETVLEAIDASGSRGIPSGHLYAALMQYMTLDQYQGFMAAMVRDGLVTQSGFVFRKVEQGVKSTA